MSTFVKIGQYFLIKVHHVLNNSNPLVMHHYEASSMDVCFVLFLFNFITFDAFQLSQFTLEWFNNSYMSITVTKTIKST